MGIKSMPKYDVDGCPHDFFYIAPVPLRSNDLFYEINRCGYASQTSPHFRVTRSDSYQYHVLHCVLGGSGGVLYRGTQHTIGKGDIFILNAHEPHSYFSDPANPLALVWVEFLGGDSDRMVQHILSTVGPIIRDEVFDSVYHLCEQIALNPNRKIAEISKDIHWMLAVICEFFANKNKLQNPLYKQVLAYIEKHLSGKLTLQEAAQYFGYQPTYFSERFTREIGLSFSKYVHQRKINQACYLLMTTNWSVDRIGQELGFYDVSHFIQRFKSIMEVSPSRYRREYK